MVSENRAENERLAPDGALDREPTPTPAGTVKGSRSAVGAFAIERCVAQSWTTNCLIACVSEKNITWVMLRNARFTFKRISIQASQ